MRRGRKKGSQLQRRGLFPFPRFIRRCYLPCVKYSGDASSDLQCNSLLGHPVDSQEAPASTEGAQLLDCTVHHNGSAAHHTTINHNRVSNEAGASGCDEVNPMTDTGSDNVPCFNFHNRFRTGITPQYLGWRNMFGQHRSNAIPNREPRLSVGSHDNNCEISRSRSPSTNQDLGDTSTASQEPYVPGTPVTTDPGNPISSHISSHCGQIGGRRSLWIMDLPLSNSLSPSQPSQVARDEHATHRSSHTDTHETHSRSSSTISLHSFDPSYSLQSESRAGVSNWTLMSSNMALSRGALVLEDSTLNTESTTDPTSSDPAVEQPLSASTADEVPEPSEIGFEASSGDNDSDRPYRGASCGAESNPLAYLFQGPFPSSWNSLESTSTYQSDSTASSSRPESPRLMPISTGPDATGSILPPLPCSSTTRDTAESRVEDVSQNWYFYDPRLAPAARLNRFTQHTSYNGIENIMSLPDIIRPPAYDEIDSGAVGDPWLREAPPPYPDSDIDPPPPYSSAANSLTRTASPRVTSDIGGEEIRTQPPTSCVGFSDRSQIPESDIQPHIELRSQVEISQSEDDTGNPAGRQGLGLLGGRPAVRWNVTTGVGHWASNGATWLTQ